MSSGQIRASKPKVRTGCRRCKARRVKCDETKPQCLRCIQYGRPCTGFDPLPHSVNRSDPKPKVLVPKANTFKLLVPLLDQPSPSASLLSGETEHQYFRYFRETTAVQLSGGFEEEVWNRIVLQASHNVPSIQRLVISIGALSRSRELQTTAQSSKQAILALDKYALDEYSQALKGIQQLAKTNASAAPPNITRIILIASILIYTFESYHGNTETAIAYLKSALAVALRNKPRTGPILYRHLGTNLLSRDIEDELITAFARLDGQLANRHDNPDPTIPTVLGMRMDYYDEPYVVPSQFFDTQTARRYLEHIQYRSRPNVSTPDSNSTETPSMGSSEEVTLFKAETRRMVTVKEMEELRMQQMQWMSAFQPLYEKIFGNPRDGSFIAAKMLRVQGLQTYLLLYGPLRPNISADMMETEDGVLESVCEEILELCREVVADERFTAGFMFTYGLIPALLVVILSAPKRTTGWEAVRVLRSMRGRVEGTWDSEGVAKMGEGILMMQEMGGNQGSSTG